MNERSPLHTLIDGDRESFGYWRILGLIESSVTSVVNSSTEADRAGRTVHEIMQLFLDALPELESERDILLFLIHTIRHVLAECRKSDSSAVYGLHGGWRK